MDIKRFSISVDSYRILPDWSTYEYELNVKYGVINWSLWKRFSEFDSLLHDLHHINDLKELPQLPNKTTFGRKLDEPFIKLRQRGLQVFLQSCLNRPDIRTSSCFIKFINFEENTNSLVSSLMPQRCCSTIPNGMTLSKCILVDNIRNLVIGIYEDMTGLSYIGKVWDVIDPEDVGIICLWQIDLYDKSITLIKSATRTTKLRDIFYHEDTCKLYIGLSTGGLEIIDLNHLYKTDTTSLKSSTFLDIKDELKCHSRSVVSLSGGKYILASFGYDSTIRLINLSTREIISGGRIAKRIGKQRITYGLLDEKNHRIFVGTDKGAVLVFNINEMSPEFVYLFNINNYVSQILIYNDNQLLITGNNKIILYTFDDDIKTIKSTNEIYLNVNINIYKTYIWNDRKWLICIYDFAFAIWNLRTFKLISASTIRSEPYCLEFLYNYGQRGEISRSGFVVIGTNHGSLGLLEFADTEYYHVNVEEEVEEAYKEDLEDEVITTEVLADIPEENKYIRYAFTESYDDILTTNKENNGYVECDEDNEENYILHQLGREAFNIKPQSFL